MKHLLFLQVVRALRALWAALTFAHRRVLCLWRSRLVVRVRRPAAAFDHLVFDAVRLWFGHWLSQGKPWPIPPLGLTRLRKRRRAIANRLRDVAAKMGVPIHVVGAAQLGAAQLGHRTLGNYCHGSVAPRINLLDVRQDDLWILAHELGHHFAITFKSDDREAAADEEARRLVEFAAEGDASWLRPLMLVRLPADGRSRSRMLGGPSLLALLLLFSTFLPWLRAFVPCYMFVFVMFAIGGSTEQVDPIAAPAVHGPTKQQARLAKLRRFVEDQNGNIHERNNALAEIRRLSQRRGS